MTDKQWRRISVLGSLLMIIYFSVVLVRGCWHNKNIMQRYAEVQKQLARETELQRELQIKLEQVHEPEFIELTARDKLGLVKPGEVAFKIVKED
jgi:cell division protein FtsB